MIYYSLDLETTGLNPKSCQILELAIVREDSNKRDVPVEELPYFQTLVRWDVIHGSAFALNMNAGLLKQLAEKAPNIHGSRLFAALVKWIDQYEKLKERNIVLAGKNVMGFDIPFLLQLSGARQIWHHRVIDPGSLFIDWTNDAEPPNTKTCETRAGVEIGSDHTALQDARNVITLLRSKYGS